MAAGLLWATPGISLWSPSINTGNTTLNCLFSPGAQRIPTGVGYAKQWNVDSVEVRMHIEDSIHYHVHDDEGEASEYAKLLPSRGYVVGLPNDPHTYTIGMFHQLRCLELIRERYVHPNAETSFELLNHCLNYLRQTILCESSTRLESVRKHIPPKVVELTGEYRCRDWTKLYVAVQE